MRQRNGEGETQPQTLELSASAAEGSRHRSSLSGPLSDSSFLPTHAIFSREKPPRPQLQAWHARRASVMAGRPGLGVPTEEEVESHPFPALCFSPNPTSGACVPLSPSKGLHTQDYRSPRLQRTLST